MMVSFPLLAARRAAAQAIAASGVSDLDDDSDHAFAVASVRIGRTVVWRSPEPAGNPYVVTVALCPECATRLAPAGGCVSCPACGWGKCG